MTKKIVVRVAEEVFAKAGQSVHYMVGTMIEIPRAALTADPTRRVTVFEGARTRAGQQIDQPSVNLFCR